MHGYLLQSKSKYLQRVFFCFVSVYSVFLGMCLTILGTADSGSDLEGKDCDKLVHGRLENLRASMEHM